MNFFILLGLVICSSSAFTGLVSGCDDDTHECPDGSIVPRNPNDDCKFYPCFRECPTNDVALPGTCSGIAGLPCQTGYFCVGGYPPGVPDAGGWCCPESCPKDKQKCRHSDVKVTRDPMNDCNFFLCPGQCRQGSSLPNVDCYGIGGRPCPNGYMCEIGEKFPDIAGWCCPNVACTEDLKICPDGTGVGRNPNSNPACEFFPCPGECPDGEVSNGVQCSTQYDCGIGTDEDFVCVFDRPSSDKSRQGWCCPASICILRKFDYIHKVLGYFEFTINGKSSEEEFKAIKGSGSTFKGNKGEMSTILLKYVFEPTDHTDNRGFRGKICLKVRSVASYDASYAGIPKVTCNPFSCSGVGGGVYRDPTQHFEEPKAWNSICLDAPSNSFVEIQLHPFKNRKIRVKRYNFSGCEQKT